MAISRKIRSTGCYFGGLLGDSFGYPFEDKHYAPGSLLNSAILQKIQASSYLQNTDDTQMALGILQCAYDLKKLDYSTLAQRFRENYVASPNRYYGGHIIGLMIRFQKAEYEEKTVLTLSFSQFDGTGSAGNGAAMRIAPFTCFIADLDLEQFTGEIYKVSAVTHAHPMAVYGALVIALPLKKILTSDGCLTLESLEEQLKFLDDVLSMLKSTKPYILKLYQQTLEQLDRYDDFMSVYNANVNEAINMYGRLFSLAKGHLTSGKFNPEQVVKDLGSNLLANRSVVTSLYLFLSVLRQPNTDDATDCGIIETSTPMRCIFRAIQLGEDTDTVACMAGALVGAYKGFSEQEFPKELREKCEDHDTFEKYIQFLNNP